MCQFIAVALDIIFLVKDLGFTCRLYLEGTYCVSNMKRKKCKLFPPLFEKKHFC